MKIGDKVTCHNVDGNMFLVEGIEYTVTGISADESGSYMIQLDGLGDLWVPEAVLTVPEQVPPTPLEDIMAKLYHWRDEWIHAENTDDEDEAEKCKKHLDFYLDKLNLLKAPKTPDQADDEALVEVQQQVASAS